MKEIWINLELYIKSYEFSNFLGFFWIFLINFAIFNVKNDLKIKQKGFCFRAGPTCVQRGTQGHVTEPRGPTRRLRGEM